ncbi:hypothetical protein [Fibrobacter sp. UWB13]|uniref:hypothetical protein n=1 Tax=Fibrobacter sp. UWB13 TaxID=1896204 RepID=UPI000A098847|nr:hypothetical protein [Fibrobacter sp. UWB13]SMG37266.1 hypothetical protein SAMN05720489_2552 [Fibrobacter sp. UWB13]
MSVFFKMTELIALASVFSFASEYSVMQAYDLVADGDCESARKMIKEESEQLSFRLSSEKSKEGMVIINNIQNACSYIATAEEFFKKVAACGPSYCPGDGYKIGEWTYKLYYDGLSVTKVGSSKLKKRIENINEQFEFYKEIVKWKKQGYYNREEIDLFMKNQIPLDSAISWNAGTRDRKKMRYNDKQEFSAKEMIDWYKGGYSYIQAQNFKFDGITFDDLQKNSNRMKFLSSGKFKYDLNNWLKCSVSDENLFKWSEISESCEEIKAWLNENVEFEEAKKWMQIGKHTELAIMCMNSGIPFDELKEWVGSQMTLDEIKKWRNVNIGRNEAVKWKSLKIEPEKAAEWQKNGFNVEKDEAWIIGDIYIDPKEANKWRKNGFSAIECQLFTMYDISMQQAQSIFKSVRQKCSFSSVKKLKESLKLVSYINNENPYDTKGKCFVGVLYFSKLKSRNEAYFVNENDAPVLVKSKKSIPVNSSIWGFYYSNGATSYKNGLGVETILPSLEAIYIKE